MSLEGTTRHSQVEKDLDNQSLWEQIQHKAEKIYPSVSKLLSESRFNMVAFVDPYGSEVQKDVQKLREEDSKDKSRLLGLTQKERQSEEQAKKLSVICEAAFLRGIIEEKWLGDNVKAHATSLYDDRFNHTDLVVEFKKTQERSSSVLGLAVDVTFSTQLSRKFREIKSEIDRGELGKIKYFESDDKTIHGQLSKIPRVVVGFGNNRIKAIVDRWDGEGRNPFQEPLLHDEFLEEIHLQLSAFKTYAVSVGKQEVADAYERALTTLEGVMEAHPLSTDSVKFTEDNVFKEIVKNVEMFEGKRPWNSERGSR